MTGAKEPHLTLAREFGKAFEDERQEGETFKTVTHRLLRHKPKPWRSFRTCERLWATYLADQRREEEEEAAQRAALEAFLVPHRQRLEGEMAKFKPYAERWEREMAKVEPHARRWLTEMRQRAELYERQMSRISAGVVKPRNKPR